MKQCSAPGCSSQIKMRYLACRRHWFQLPLSLRSELADRALPIIERRQLYRRALEIWSQKAKAAS